MNATANFDFMSNDTTFAAEGASENASKREMTPFQKGVCAVAAVGIAGAAVGAGLYWCNRGIKATADNIGAAVDGIKTARENAQQKKLEKAQQLLNQNQG